MKWRIPLFKTYTDESDVDAVTKIIRRGTYWADGEEVKEFEKGISNYIGTKHSLCFNSGTSALHTLLLACDVKEKEVIVPSFTFIATANAVILAGGIPVFAETETETYGLNADDVIKKITDNTKVIITLQYGGFPSRDSHKLREIADNKGLIFVEDAAAAFGSKIGDKMVGSFGHASIFSFCQNKVIATGEGGAIVTDAQNIYERSKLLRSHGRVELAQDYFSSTEDNDYIEAGFNFRMPTMLAALGLSQLSKIQTIIDLRRNNGKYLSDELSKIKGITVPNELSGAYSVYQMYTIRLENENIRNNLQKYLTDKGIMCKVYFNPVHLKTIYTKKYGYKEGDLPITEELSKKVLTLPFYPSLNKEDLDYMIDNVKEFFNKGD